MKVNAFIPRRCGIFSLLLLVTIGRQIRPTRTCVREIEENPMGNVESAVLLMGVVEALLCARRSKLFINITGWSEWSPPGLSLVNS